MTLPDSSRPMDSGRKVTCTVVSVMPYMFTSLGCLSPCRSNHGPETLHFQGFAAKYHIAQGQFLWPDRFLRLDQLAKSGGVD